MHCLMFIMCDVSKAGETLTLWWGDAQVLKSLLVCHGQHHCLYQLLYLLVKTCHVLVLQQCWSSNKCGAEARN